MALYLTDLISTEKIKKLPKKLPKLFIDSASDLPNDYSVQINEESDDIWTIPESEYKRIEQIFKTFKLNKNNCIPSNIFQIRLITFYFILFFLIR